MNVLCAWSALASPPAVCEADDQDTRALLDALEEAAAFVRRHAHQDLPPEGPFATPVEAALDGLWRSIAQDQRGELLPALATIAAARRCVDLPPAIDLFLGMQQGRLLVMHGDAVQATTVLLEGVERARLLGARRQKARMLGNLGFLYGEVHGPTYEAYTRRALAIGRELEDARLIAHSLCNLGGALVQQGRIDEAADCLAEGLALAQDLDWGHSIALFQASIGGLHVARGELEVGLSHYAQSIAWFEAAGDPFQVARQRLIVGRSLQKAGRADEAIAMLERCLVDAGPSTIRSPAWQALKHLSELYEDKGDAVTALRLLRRSEGQRAAWYDEQFTQRLRLLELHAEAERSARLAAYERERVAVLESALAMQQQLQSEIEQLVRTDTLTGLFNRRHLTTLVTQAIGSARRLGRPLVIALLDVDHFKAINDRFGHSVGDEVLVLLAQRLGGILRSPDVLARWGGEEFAIALPDTDEEGAHAVLGRLLTTLRTQPFPTQAGNLRVTASIGYTALRPHDRTIDDLLHRADLALYDAKRGGRDRRQPFTAAA